MLYEDTALELYDYPEPLPIKQVKSDSKAQVYYSGRLKDVQFEGSEQMNGEDFILGFYFIGPDTYYNVTDGLLVSQDEINNLADNVRKSNIKGTVYLYGVKVDQVVYIYDIIVYQSNRVLQLGTWQLNLIVPNEMLTPKVEGKRSIRQWLDYHNKDDLFLRPALDTIIPNNFDFFAFQKKVVTNV